jgi:hypothetical protein
MRAMRRARNIDPKRCHAWIHEKGRQCANLRPLLAGEKNDRVWYCRHHGTWLKRTRLWLAYKRRSMPWRIRALIAAPMLILFVLWQFGPSLYGLWKDKQSDRRNNEQFTALHEEQKATLKKADEILESFSEQRVRNYLDTEYPLGYIVYKVENDKVALQLKGLGSKLNVSFAEPYLTRTAEDYVIRLTVEIRDNPLRFKGEITIPSDEGVRHGYLWFSDYGLVAEVVQKTNVADYVCLALSDDRRLFPSDFSRLKFIPTGAIASGTIDSGESWTGLCFRGTLANADSRSVGLSDACLVMRLDRRRIVFHALAAETIRIETTDGRPLVLRRASNLGVKGTELAPKESREGYFAFATRQIPTSQLEQVLKGDGIDACLEFTDTLYRTQINSDEFRIAYDGVFPDRKEEGYTEMP